MVRHRRRVPTQTLRATAAHEAGHAVAAWSLGIPVWGVSIKPRVESAGRTLCSSLLGRIQLDCDNTTQTRWKAEREVKKLLAGCLAQRKSNPRSYRHYHCKGDRDAAIKILSHITGSDAELRAYYRLLQIQTDQLLAKPGIWPCVKGVATALLEKGELSGKEVKSIIDDVYRSQLHARS